MAQMMGIFFETQSDFVMIDNILQASSPYPTMLSKATFFERNKCNLKVISHFIT